MTQKLLKQQCLPYHNLFYQCIFNSQHNVLNDPDSVIGLYARPLFKIENENIPNTLSYRPRKVGVQYNFESALYAHNSSNTVWTTCTIFQPPRSNTCSQAGVYLARQNCGVCLSRATGKGRQGMFFLLLFHTGPIMIDTHISQSSRGFCVWSCCQQMSKIFLTANLFSCSIFNFFFFFLNFSGLRQVTNMGCHLSNDSTKKTEVVKQSVCHSGVFLLRTASLLGFTKRITSLVNAWRKLLLIRGDEGHHFSLLFCFDSLVVKLRGWCLLCAPLLSL